MLSDLHHAIYSNTKIKKSPRKIDINSTIATTTDSNHVTLDEIVKIAKYVNVKVVQLCETEEINQKVKQEVIITDHMTASKVVLWEQYVDSLEEGKSYT